MSAASRLTYVWGILCAVTILAWWLATTRDAGESVRSVLITIVVLVFGLVKVRLVIANFMEVRTAPRWLAVGTDLWLAGFGVTVLSIYLW